MTREAMKPIFYLWRPAAKAPHDLKDLTIEIIKTLAPFGYGALPKDDIHAKLRIDGFVEVLDGFPIWAIAQAGLWWRKNKSEAPTPKDWADRTKIEMGWFSRISIDGQVMSLGPTHERVLKWAKGERIWE